MKKLFYLIAFCLTSWAGIAQKTQNNEAFAHTFSIVARDPQTGDMAVGVQSHWFSVGTTVSWPKQVLELLQHKVLLISLSE
jgi:hypothetical protein